MHDSWSRELLQKRLIVAIFWKRSGIRGVVNSPFTLHLHVYVVLVFWFLQYACLSSVIFNDQTKENIYNITERGQKLCPLQHLWKETTKDYQGSG